MNSRQTLSTRQMRQILGGYSEPRLRREVACARRFLQDVQNMDQRGAIARSSAFAARVAGMARCEMKRRKPGK